MRHKKCVEIACTKIVHKKTVYRLCTLVKQRGTEGEDPFGISHNVFLFVNDLNAKLNIFYNHYIFRVCFTDVKSALPIFID